MIKNLDQWSLLSEKAYCLYSGSHTLSSKNVPSADCIQFIWLSLATQVNWHHAGCLPYMCKTELIITMCLTIFCYFFSKTLYMLHHAYKWKLTLKLQNKYILICYNIIVCGTFNFFCLWSLTQVLKEGITLYQCILHL